jgi:hypothetical protein
LIILQDVYFSRLLWFCCYPSISCDPWACFSRLWFCCYPSISCDPWACFSRLWFC